MRHAVLSFARKVDFSRRGLIIVQFVFLQTGVTVRDRNTATH